MTTMARMATGSKVDKDSDGGTENDIDNEVTEQRARTTMMMEMVYR